MLKVKRSCQHCGKPDHMIRAIDEKRGVYDVRYRVCYRCHPELDAGSLLNGPDGGLKTMKSELRDPSWDALETMPREMGENDEYADDETIVQSEEIA